MTILAQIKKKSKNFTFTILFTFFNFVYIAVRIQTPKYPILNLNKQTCNLKYKIEKNFIGIHLLSAVFLPGVPFIAEWEFFP